MVAIRLPSLKARNLQNGGVSIVVSLRLNCLWSQGSSWRTWIPTSWRVRSRGGLRLLLHMHAKSVAVLESHMAKSQIKVDGITSSYLRARSQTWLFEFVWWKKCWWSLKMSFTSTGFSLENWCIDVKVVVVYLLWEARWIK